MEKNPNSWKVEWNKCTKPNKT